MGKFSSEKINAIATYLERFVRILVEALAVVSGIVYLVIVVVSFTGQFLYLTSFFI